MTTVRVSPQPAARSVWPARWTRWAWRLGSAAAGGLPTLAFPEPGVAWLAYVGLVPLLLVICAARSRREAAVRGWLGGAGFMTGVAHWLAPVTGPLLLVIVLALGSLWLGWGVLAWELLRGPRTPTRVVLAAAALASYWVLIELVRSWEYLGGPFGLLGASQWATPGMLAPAAVGGVWAVSFLAVTVNVGLAAALSPPRGSQTATGPPGRAAGGSAAGSVDGPPGDAAGGLRTGLGARPWVRAAGRAGAGPLGRSSTGSGTGPSVRAAGRSGSGPGSGVGPRGRLGGGRGGRGGRVAGLIVAVAAAAAGPVCHALRPPPEPAGQVRVGVVQVGIVEGSRARFALAERFTRQLAGQAVDLVVWGESSVGADLAARPDLTRRLQRLAAELDAPVLVNTDARRAGGPGILKSTVVVDAGGTQGRYDKQRLVPFGEYIPFRPVFGWLAGVTDAAAVDRRRGDGLRLLTAGGVQVGPLVCFETAFADMTRHLAARGAELLVGQSSTATFQHSWAPEQHASLAAVRAVETGRPMVHATLTGATTVTDAWGARLLWVPTDERGSWAVTVPLAAGTTPFVRWGGWVPVGSAVLLTALLAAGAARRTVRPR